jgi:hypothetical protein
MIDKLGWIWEKVIITYSPGRIAGSASSSVGI